MIRRPPRSTQSRSSAASDVYKRQLGEGAGHGLAGDGAGPVQVGPVQDGWFGLAPAVRLAAAHEPAGQGAGHCVVGSDEVVSVPGPGTPWLARQSAVRTTRSGMAPARPPSWPLATATGMTPAATCSRPTRHT